MKRFIITFIFVFGLFLTTSPLLACQCSADEANHSANISDQHRTCCHSDHVKKSTLRPNKPCCEQCLMPLTTGAISYEAICSQTIKDTIDKLFQTTQYEPIKPKFNWISIFRECDNSFLSSVFQIAYAPRAPPKV